MTHDPDEDDPDLFPCGDGYDVDHDQPSIDVEPTDPELVNVLFGPDGEPLLYLYDRRIIPFGFQPPQPR